VMPAFSNSTLNMEVKCSSETLLMMSVTAVRILNLADMKHDYSRPTTRADIINERGNGCPKDPAARRFFPCAWTFPNSVSSPLLTGYLLGLLLDPEGGSSTSLQTVDEPVPDYTASHPRIQYYSWSPLWKPLIWPKLFPNMSGIYLKILCVLSSKRFQVFFYNYILTLYRSMDHTKSK
jgi:hypothetical protein